MFIAGQAASDRSLKGDRQRVLIVSTDLGLVSPDRVANAD